MTTINAAIIAGADGECQQGETQVTTVSGEGSAQTYCANATGGGMVDPLADPNFVPATEVETDHDDHDKGV